MLFIRSLIINIGFYIITALVCIGMLPFLLMKNGEHYIYKGARIWSSCSLWLIRVVGNITVEFRNTHLIPTSACIFAPKHQSAWETFALFQIIPKPVYAVKKEVTFIPLFGFYMLKCRLIILDRGTRSKAMKSLLDGAKRIFSEGRQLTIFPEGTRRNVDAPPDYKLGLTLVYENANVPVIPIAMNSGLVWPRRKFLRYPGKVIVEVLPHIPPGLPREEFKARIQESVETATARLIEETRQARGFH